MNITVENNEVVVELTVEDQAADQAQQSAVIALQAKNDTQTIKGQVDNTKGEIDTIKGQIDLTAGQVNQAKTDAEAAVPAAQSWAEGIEPGGVGTKSAKGHAEDAQGFAGDAETSKNAITDKLDLTGTFQVGEIPRVQDVGGVLKFVRVNENRILRMQNCLESYPDDRVIFWDDFLDNDGELNGRVSPKGQEWSVKNITTLADVNGEVSVANQTARKTSGTLDIAALFPISVDPNGLNIESRMSYGSTTTLPLFYFLDIISGNCIVLSFSAGYSLRKYIGGVYTTLSSASSNANPGTSSQSEAGNQYEISLTRRASVSQFHIGFRAIGYIGGFDSSDAEFYTIMNNITHIGVSGFRGFEIAGIRLTKVW